MGVSLEAKILIKSMLNKDYRHRPYARDVLNDTWFENASKKPFDKQSMTQAFSNMKKF